MRAACGVPIGAAQLPHYRVGVSARAQQILHEAARMFAERGYGATSIDDLGAAVGVSGPAIYHHFNGKQALLAAMLTDVSERLLASARDCVRTAENDAAALEALVAMQVEVALDEPSLIVVHGRELRHLDTEQAHRVRALQRQYIDVWVDVLQRRSPSASRQRLAAAAQAAIGLVNSTPYVGRLPRKSLAPLLHTMALAALAAA